MQQCDSWFHETVCRKLSPKMCSLCVYACSHHGVHSVCGWVSAGELWRPDDDFPSHFRDALHSRKAARSFPGSSRAELAAISLTLLLTLYATSHFVVPLCLFFFSRKRITLRRGVCLQNKERSGTNTAQPDIMRGETFPRCKVLKC